MKQNENLTSPPASALLLSTSIDQRSFQSEPMFVADVWADWEEGVKIFDSKILKVATLLEAGETDREPLDLLLLDFGTRLKMS